MIQYYIYITVYHDIVYSDLWKNDAAETEVTFLASWKCHC